MYLKVKVITKARTEKIEEDSKGGLKIWVKQAAENNAANKRVLELVRERFPRYNKSVRIINGHHHPSKLLELSD
jgi:uncharacterized protein YggU (UPF0235/DUF167 family)